MKLAVLTLAYNEEETIAAVLKNWIGIADRHLVLLSEKPWHGIPERPDTTEDICHQYGAEVIKMSWQSETEQRNWGLAYLYNYDYVLIVDADELWTYEDQQKIYRVLSEGCENEVGSVEKEACYRCSKVKTYWKNTDYILDPPDTHQPIIAVNPKKILFQEFRIPNTDWQPLIDVTLHHLSYAKSDKKIFNKIHQFEHYNQIIPSWFETVWREWNEDMIDIRPYGIEKSKAIKEPLPLELQQLYVSPTIH